GTSALGRRQTLPESPKWGRKAAVWLQENQRLLLACSSFGHAQDKIGHSQTGHQAGTFDSKEIDDGSRLMVERSIDAEVAGWLAIGGDLGADAAIGRMKRALGQARPVTPDLVVERVGPRRIDGIVDRISPFDV